MNYAADRQLTCETNNHPHVPEERAELFKSYDSATTEDEYLHLIYSLVYCLKPLQVLETGSWQGIGSVFICRALGRNGLGHLWSIEKAPMVAQVAREQLRINGLSQWGTVITGDSVDWIKECPKIFDFIFFDSLLPLRCVELNLCLDKGLLRSGRFFAMHDTSRLRITKDERRDVQSEEFWDELGKIDRVKILEFPFSRGLVLGQVR